MSARLRVTSADGRHLGTVQSERAARRLAREHLRVERVSEWPESDGWSLYPSGQRDCDDRRVVRVTVVQS